MSSPVPSSPVSRSRLRSEVLGEARPMGKVRSRCRYVCLLPPLVHTPHLPVIRHAR